MALLYSRLRYLNLSASIMVLCHAPAECHGFPRESLRTKSIAFSSFDSLDIEIPVIMHARDN
jgi:hypothetical protein